MGELSANNLSHQQPNVELLDDPGQPKQEHY
jgi:hypothetical protein